MTQESFAGPNLLTIPYVVRDKVLSQLTLHEQLNLRKVCRDTRDWIDYSSVLHHAPQTVIQDHGAKTFSKFLEKRPPHIIRSIYIENDSCDFLDDPGLEHFLRIYSSLVTTLRVKRFFTCQSPKELSFYERFANVSELELEKISIPSTSDVVSGYPANFKNLKVLRIGCVKAFPEPPDDLFAAALIPFSRQRPMGLYVWNLIKFCEKIEYLGYPKTSKYFFQAFVDGRGRGEFGVFCDYIRHRHLQHPNEPNLKFCDFQNEHWSPDSKNALTLLKLGNEFGIKYLNLNANQFIYQKIDALVRMYSLPKSTKDCIVSFKNFNCLISDCLPAVEKISMSSSEVNTMLDYSCLFNGPEAFPNLKEIEIKIDTGFTHEAESDIYRRAREFKDVQILLSHFFYDMDMTLYEDFHDSNDDMEPTRKYDSVTSLTIKFTEILNVDIFNRVLVKARPEDLPLEWIIKGVPNLKKLRLSGWCPKSQETYWKLWMGFPHLEELILEDCANLTRTCFLGCPDLLRVSIKNSKVPEIIDESLREYLEDERSMQSSHFLNQSCSMKKLTWIKC